MVVISIEAFWASVPPALNLFAKWGDGDCPSAGRSFVADVRGDLLVFMKSARLKPIGFVLVVVQSIV